MADISGLYLVATNDNVTAEDHNSLVEAIQNVNADLPANGNAQITYDAFGNPVSATDGAESYTYTPGLFGQIGAASDGTTSVAANRDTVGNLTGFTTT